MNTSISHNGLVRCFLVMVLYDCYKVEYEKLTLKPKSSSVQLVGINMKMTYCTKYECVSVIKKMKVCYAWVYNQEAIMSAVFVEFLKCLKVYVQVHCKEVNTQMLVYTPTDMREGHYALKGEASIAFEEVQPILMPIVQMHGLIFSLVLKL